MTCRDMDVTGGVASRNYLGACRLGRRHPRIGYRKVLNMPDLGTLRHNYNSRLLFRARLYTPTFELLF